LDDKDETSATREADDEAPFSSLAFKIATDPFVGTLTFFRVYSGTLYSEIARGRVGNESEAGWSVQ